MKAKTQTSRHTVLESLRAKYEQLPGWKPEDFPIDPSPEEQVPELEKLIEAADQLNVMFSRCNVEPLDQQIFRLYHMLWDEIAQRLLGTGLHLVISKKRRAS